MQKVQQVNVQCYELIILFSDFSSIKFYPLTIHLKVFNILIHIQ